MITYHTIPELGFESERDPAKWWDLYQLPARLDGKTLLDIGTWTGGFALQAWRRGAAKVTALDRFEHSVSGGMFVHSGQVYQVKQLCDDRFVVIDHDIQDPVQFEPHDVVLFLQVFYHLTNPFAGLCNAARATRLGGDLFVESIVAVGNDKPAMYWLGIEFHTDYWLPTKKLLESLFTAFGLTYRITWETNGRCCWHCVRAQEQRYTARYLLPHVERRAGNAYDFA